MYKLQTLQLCSLGCSVRAGLLVMAYSQTTVTYKRTSRNVFSLLIADPVVYSPTRTCYNALVGPNSDVDNLKYFKLKSTNYININMNFTELVKEVLHEEMMSGGEGSVYGPNVGSTANAFSGDNYAEGDARNVYGLYPGVMTRKGMSKKSRSKKKKKKRRKKK